MSTPSNKEKLNRMVYVGGLPADATAEEMKQLCSQVGEVIRFQIIYDRETQQPRGFGFCEYRDAQLVDAAVELLDKFEHRGASLNVCRPPTSINKHQQSHSNSSKLHSQNSTGSTQPTKKKKTSSKVKPVDEITRVVASLSTSEKREILSQIKEFIEQNEKAANDVLSDNPQLAQALLLIQMEFNLVKSQDIQALTRYVSNKVTMPTPKQTETKERNTNTIGDNKEQHVVINVDNDVEMKDIPPPPAPAPMVQAVPQLPQPQSPQPPQLPQPQAVLAKNANDTEQVNEDRWNALSDQQKAVVRQVTKMTPAEFQKLPEEMQRQVRAVQKRLFNQNE